MALQNDLHVDGDCESLGGQRTRKGIFNGEREKDGEGK